MRFWNVQERRVSVRAIVLVICHAPQAVWSRNPLVVNGSDVLEVLVAGFSPWLGSDS